MANLSKRLSANVEGNFFVDDTCINCDTCRQLAPTTFQEVGEYSAVSHQPLTPSHQLEAYQALLACPVRSIGTVTKNKDLLVQAQKSFPIELAEGVYYNGFNSEKSFGANSYFFCFSSRFMFYSVYSLVCQKMASRRCQIKYVFTDYRAYEAI